MIADGSSTGKRSSVPTNLNFDLNQVTDRYSGSRPIEEEENTTERRRNPIHLSIADDGDKDSKEQDHV